MSSSPGSKLSPHASPRVEEQTAFSIDPVKLIDERIKVTTPTDTPSLSFPYSIS